ncbi:APC family permease [Methanosarcina sp. MSH10X1]|uniref:APC family permease n=1 Tax=Methanosarcina sp. MSH10X1 TaxID=2507075 RepID=UPI000FFBD1A4|nr:APC family permease [Methanosarcina sp. MSH10X1]RXA17605.1 APC family permease [Methanosarcina sp. MSH10X1]
MTGLQKTITLKRGIGLAICMLIGTGILALPGLALSVGNVHEAILGWFLITFVTIPRIQICSRLGLRFPSTAGLAGYAEEAVGPWGRYSVSYLVSGSYLFGLPAIAFIGSEYMRQFFNLSELGGALCAILLVSLMFISNLFGIRAITLINYLALTVLFLLIGLIIVFNIDFIDSGLRIAGEALSNRGNADPNIVWNVTALLFWAFLGWENLSFFLGEMKDPEKNVPRLYWLSFVLVAAIYVLLALISVGASATGVSLKGAAGLSSLVLLIPGGNFLIWLIIIVLAANACSWNFTASRLLYASGRTDVFPAVFGKLSKRNIPLSSLVILYALSVSLITGCYFFKVPVTAMMLLVNQNFIFLCGFIIIAYWKTETGWQKWIFSVLSLLSLSFLASGFTWKVIYPLFLMGLGYFRFIVKKEDKLSVQSVDSQSRQELAAFEDSQELSQPAKQ